MKGRIREYIQCDVGHGDSALFDIEYENNKEEKETRFILVDVGDKKGNQFEDLKNCVESHKEEKPIKTSIKIGLITNQGAMKICTIKALFQELVLKRAKGEVLLF